MPIVPMFPLGTVLFPTIGLPLRIFEPRYRALTRDCLLSDHRFGVVLIERGSEVGGTDDRFDVGTMARIVQSEVAADGQAVLMTVGEQRFRINRWVDGELYPRADVEFFSDSESPEDVVSANEIDRVTKRIRRTLAMQAELNLAAAPSTVEFSGDAEQRLWQFCAVVPATPYDDLALLCTSSGKARLALIERLLDSSEVNANRLLSGS
jgi:uncharacterized protein